MQIQLYLDRLIRRKKAENGEEEEKKVEPIILTREMAQQMQPRRRPGAMSLNSARGNRPVTTTE